MAQEDRGGGNGVPQTFDGQVAASADDGYWDDGGTFQDTGNSMFVGVFSDGDGAHLWARFSSVTVPQGATIDAAYFEPFTISSTKDGEGVMTNIYLEAADDPAAPTSKADAAGRDTTANFTAWDDQDFPGGFEQSDSIVSVIQEMTDRGGWASGQAMQILCKDDGGTTNKYYRFATYDDNPARGAKLHIEYTA